MLGGGMLQSQIPNHLFDLTLMKAVTKIVTLWLIIDSVEARLSSDVSYHSPSQQAYRIFTLFTSLYMIQDWIQNQIPIM